MNVPNVEPLLAETTGTTQTVAFEAGYKIALDKIRAIGITEEWVKQWRETRDWSKPELAPYIKRVQEKTQSQGYVKFYIAKASKAGKDKRIHYQLIGVTPDGRLDILSTTRATADMMEGKQQALIMYLEA